MKPFKSCIKYLPSATIKAVSLLSISSALIVSQMTSPFSVNGQSATQRLYQLHDDGWIWQYTGTACIGNSCPGWQRLDNNPKTRAIVAAGTQLYQLHNDGWIWRYTGTACTGNSCPGWQRLDNNPKTRAIVAAES